MTGIFLVRHGSHKLVNDVLIGRSNDVAISREGSAQIFALAGRLRNADIRHIQSSPQLRCLQSALILAEQLSLSVSTELALDEIDFGAWRGLRFCDLARDREWQHWNHFRSKARAPGGESAIEAQQRILEHVEVTRRRYSHGGILMVTHAELIRAAILARLNLSLDLWGRITIEPGSIIALDCVSHDRGDYDTLAVS